MPQCDLVFFEHVLGEDEPYELKTDLKSVGRLITEWWQSGLGCEDLPSYKHGRKCGGCEDLHRFEDELLGGMFANAGDALTEVQSWKEQDEFQ